MKHRLRAAALAAALLLLPAALADTAPQIDLEAGVEIDPGDVAVELEAPELPELSGLTDDLTAATPEPTVAPTREPKEKKPAWLTSVNYSRSKVSFENEIWSILTGKWGLADYQAAGLMSSIRAESSYCPYNVQGMGGSDDRGAYTYDIHDSVGFGLCQWTSSGRKAALQHYAIAHGSADLVWDFDTQMGFMAKELDMAALKATATLYEAAEWAVMRYERPNQRYVNSWPGTRYEMGRVIFRNHTGKDYVEPELRFSVKHGDADALAEGRLALAADAQESLVVDSNYYWRLTQVYATVDDWLEVRCASFYHPEQTEPCVCGYVCEGEKTLTLSVAEPPEPGETRSVTLRFEIYRGKRVVRTVEVVVTGE